MSIEGPAQADIVKKEVHNGVLTIDYLPVIPGEYMVNVKSHGKHIHGSPFSARISGSSDCYLYLHHYYHLHFAHKNVHTKQKNTTDTEQNNNAHKSTDNCRGRIDKIDSYKKL